MNENAQTAESNINVSELLYVLLKKLWLIVLVAILCAGGAFAYCKLTYSPVYTSTAMIYIMNTKPGESLTASDINASSYLTSDYEQLITSRTVLEMTIKNLKLGMTVAELEKDIMIVNPKGTRMLEISVTANDPTMAKKIADEICRIVSDSIVEIMGIDRVNLVDEGNMPDKPSNSINKQLIILSGVLGAFLICAVVYVIFILDDKIKSAEDIEKYLGLTLLGVIPYTEKYQSNEN